MSNQRKYKFKGVRGIKKVLTQYYKKRYADPEKLKSKANEINRLLQKQKLNPTVDNILGFARKKQQAPAKGVKVIPTTKQPELPDSLQQASYYFELIEYPRYILTCTNQIWFTSNLWTEGLPDIQGGTLIEYETYFQNYVNHINSMKAMTTPQDKKYETDWLIKCTEPVWNPITKRWESKIISVDFDGDIIDYGFDPKNPQQSPASLILSQKGKGKPTTKQPEPTPTKEPTPQKKTIEELKKEVELEKTKQQTIKEQKELEKAQEERIRQENIKLAMELFKSGDLTKAEFKEMMNDLKKK